MRKLAIGKLFGVVFALFSILCAIFFYSFANHYDEQFQNWTTARPMTTEIDFSQPGMMTVPFHQTCSSSHGEGIFLDHDLTDTNGGLPAGRLSGLSASIVIHDHAGKEIVKRALVDSRDQPLGGRIVRISPGEILLADLPTFKIGDYKATITVDEGLPALAGLPQSIYAKYELCGCEQMPGAVSGVFSFCAGFIGIIGVVCVAPGLMRSGIWRDVTAEAELEEDES